MPVANWTAPANMLYGLYPYLKFFAVLGLVPWSEKPSRQKAQKFYTIGIVLLQITLFLLAMYAPPNEEDLPVSQLVSGIVFVGHMVTMSVLLIQVVLQYKGFYEFCMDLKCLQLRFQCEAQVQAVNIPKLRFLKLILLGSASVLTLTPGVFLGCNGIYVGYFLYSIGPVLINRCQTVLILLYGELLIIHIELLYQQLHKILKCRLLTSNCILNSDSERLCSLEFLLTLKQAYMELYGLYNRFNCLYGWSILFIFVVMFLDATVNIYWTLLALTDIYSYVNIGMSCIIFMPQLALIFALCSCGELSKRQHELIGSQIRGLSCVLQCQKDAGLHDYKRLLVEFSMQVEQDGIAINAEGFMDIDYGLLMSIFTAMVTYLIVLMQFGSF